MRTLAVRSLSFVAVAFVIGCGVDRSALEPAGSPDAGAAGGSAGAGGSSTGGGGSSAGAGGASAAGNSGAAGEIICSGVNCSLVCPYGLKVAASGCPLCECNPSPPCGPVCEIYCPYGNAVDDKGCAICKCNPPPTGPCTPTECGPGPGVPSKVCPDGVTVAGPVCLRDPMGACGWRVTECPAVTCEPSQCPGPAPGVPNYLCPDGMPVPPPECVPLNGACVWIVSSCPTPPPSVCNCASGQVCVQQIGGPATTYPPPPPKCETPNPMCLATIDAPYPSCACLAASDGKCKSNGTQSCVCDNGIR
jgi:hypothetical protein